MRRALRTERILLPGVGKDDVLAAVTRVLDFANDDSLKRIIVDREQSVVKVERYLHHDEVPESAYSFAKHKDVVEFELEGQNPYEELHQIYELIRKEEFAVTHILCGGYQFHAWARISKKSPTILGVPIFISDVPEDVFLVCAADDKDGSIEDVKFSVKVTLP